MAHRANSIHIIQSTRKSKQMWISRVSVCSYIGKRKTISLVCETRSSDNIRIKEMFKYRREKNWNEARFPCWSLFVPSYYMLNRLIRRMWEYMVYHSPCCRIAWVYHFDAFVWWLCMPFDMHMVRREWAYLTAFDAVRRPSYSSDASACVHIQHWKRSSIPAAISP